MWSPFTFIAKKPFYETSRLVLNGRNKVTGVSEAWQSFYYGVNCPFKLSSRLTWLVWSQYLNFCLRRMCGRTRWKKACSPARVSKAPVTPTHSNRNNPEKWRMPICSVWTETEQTRRKWHTVVIRTEAGRYSVCTQEGSIILLTDIRLAWEKPIAFPVCLGWRKIPTKLTLKIILLKAKQEPHQD